MDFGIKGKYAFVTGGSYGIGSAVALSLAAEGVNVAVCARNVDGLQAVKDKIASLGVETLALQCDVMNAKNVDDAFDEISRTWGGVDILINNVGGGGEQMLGPICTVPESKWVEVYQKNVLSAMRFTMKALPYMIEANWGRIVTISSIAGKEALGKPWYTTAKAAEIAMMKSLSKDASVVSRGVTFNSVAPGPILFKGNEWDVFRNENPEKFQNKINNEIPVGRLGRPEEVADIVTYLCSRQADYINGSCIAIDGGQSRSY